jgi:hypothetical protein
MKNLVIKGHATRGNEVIEILEMLGGKNSTKLVGNASSCGYYIDSDGNIAYHYYSSSYFNDAIQFTIEEFLEKYPYKVGDKVHHIIDNENQIITDLVWDEDEVLYKTTNNFGYVYVNYLQPHKEETMEEEKKDYEEWSPIDYLEFENNDDTWADEVEVNLGKDYEIQIRGDKTFIVKKKSQYPKTYEECCKIIDYYLKGITIIGYKVSLLENFQKLLVCRDAYWKIAGEQMGLGKLWKPDSKNIVHYIYYSMYDNEIQVSCGNLFDNEILAFPTAEMRDAFYENFKNLIEVCKELL